MQSTTGERGNQRVSSRYRRVENFDKFLRIDSFSLNCDVKKLAEKFLPQFEDKKKRVWSEDYPGTAECSGAI